MAGFPEDFREVFRALAEARDGPSNPPRFMFQRLDVWRRSLDENVHDAVATKGLTGRLKSRAASER
jgi:phytoene/squalene synthetase